MEVDGGEEPPPDDHEDVAPEGIELDDIDPYEVDSNDEAREGQP